MYPRDHFHRIWHKTVLKVEYKCAAESGFIFRDKEVTTQVQYRDDLMLSSWPLIFSFLIPFSRTSCEKAQLHYYLNRSFNLAFSRLGNTKWHFWRLNFFRSLLNLFVISLHPKKTTDKIKSTLFWLAFLEVENFFHGQLSTVRYVGSN